MNNTLDVAWAKEPATEVGRIKHFTKVAVGGLKNWI